MKKILVFFLPVCSALAARAQDNHHLVPGISMKMFEIIATIFLLLSVMAFILAMTKRIFEYRIKNRIVEKGVSESLAVSILQTRTGEARHAPVKWFAILAGTGVGLTIINYTLPLGIHSLAIMFFSIAFSFLGYYLFLRKTTKGTA